MNHYYPESELLAEKIINTTDTTREEPEYLRSPLDLARYLKNWNVHLEREPNEEDLTAVLALRGKLRAVYESKDITTVVGLLNALLEGVQVRPHIGLEPGGKIQLELNAGEDLPFARRLALEAVLGLYAAIEKYGLERLRVCSAVPCTEVFIDTSRNQTRRYCCVQCANRHNVAAYRQRKKTGKQHPDFRN